MSPLDSILVEFELTLLELPVTSSKQRFTHLEVELSIAEFGFLFVEVHFSSSPSHIRQSACLVIHSLLESFCFLIN